MYFVLRNDAALWFPRTLMFLNKQQFNDILNQPVMPCIDNKKTYYSNYFRRP